MSAIAKATAVLRRRWVWIPGAVLGAVVLSYVAAYVYVGGDVPRGTTVRGVDIGGMTPAAAERKLDEGMGAVAKKPVQVQAGSEVYRVDPEQADMAFDAEATVRAAGDRSANPVQLVRQTTRGTQVEPVVRANEKKLTQAVGELAGAHDRPVREGRVRYKGTEPVSVLPRAGRGIDRAAAVERITDAYPTADTVRLPVEKKKPKSTAADVREIAAEDARTAVSAPVRLGTGKTKLSVSEEALAANTEYVADSSGKLGPKVDGHGLAKDIGSELARLETKSRNATIAVRGDKPTITPSKAGRMVDRKELGAAVAGVLDKTGDRSVAAPVKKAKPKVTTADMKKLGIKEKISSFTTEHLCCEPRVTNIHRAADILDGTLVRPGQVFSLNGTLGQRTTEKGFVPAPMIMNGRHIDSVGGGVSQIATTTFNAMFFAGLEDVQHKPHSYYISRYPLGREATVSWTQPDLRFRNDSDTGILVTTSYTDTSITVNMWGTKRYDVEATSPKKSNYREPKTIRDKSKDCTPESPAEGYDVTYARVFKQGGEVVRTEPFRTAYLAAPRVICVQDEKKQDREKASDG